jgi:trans-feruloyl-CoA hydratase/vanillin synthase
MTQYQALRIEKENQVTTIVLNRPEKRNAMNPQMHFDMNNALEELAHDPETRVLIITGAGESFCGGQDLKQFFLELADKPVEKAKAAEASNHWRMKSLRFFPTPTIAMVNGFCFGGGMGVVAACDIAIAAEDAIFGLSEINWGIFPGSTLPKAMPELVSFRDVLYYSLTGEQFDGRKASEIRFVNFAVPRAQLKEATMRVARTLTEKDPAALKATKEVMKLALDMDYEQVFAWTEAKGQVLRMSTGQRWKQGVEQFQDGKYRPGFEGYDWKEATKEPNAK